MGDVVELQKHQVIHINDVPQPLREDLINFLFGKTLQRDNIGYTVNKEDYKSWLSKLNTEGIDYDIQLTEAV